MSYLPDDASDAGVSAVYDDPQWAIGQMLVVGWDGSEVTPQIRKLIQEYHVGSIILTPKNLKSAQHATKLVKELQTIAYHARHPQPLLIAIDQESGGVNSLFDQEFLCGFPSAMGMAATGSVDLAYETNKATAEAVRACGINMIVGPVLDVLLNIGYQPLGVRSVGDDPNEVSSYGIAAMNGIKDAGLAACGKHFPTCGSLDFLGSSLDMPIITQTLEELKSSALVPFRNAIATGRLETVLVSGCGLSNPSMNIPHACLSSRIVDDLLRQELGFKGVALSECLEMEALSQDIGIQNGAVMAVEAGFHENLIQRAATIIIVTANASRNLYQTSFAKHVDLMCSVLRMQGEKKSVIIIAVSSPYDFVLDKTIGTYLCTFDFTENAMQALVRVLWGDCVAQGSLPGTLRKTRKASKPRQNWIVEDYDHHRDGPHLKGLLHALSQTSSASLKHLCSATTETFEVPSPRMQAAHFVVRNSSTNALYGFAATYCVEDTGILAAILVDPAKQNVSIGRSLHRRGIVHLKMQQGITKLQLGSSFPGAFPGVPLDDPATVKWFADIGWNMRPSRRLTNLKLGDLDSWSIPDDTLGEIRRASITFDLVQGSTHVEESDAVLALVNQHATPEVSELYQFALSGAKACGIVRAKESDGMVLGIALLCAPRSPFSTFIPALASAEEDIGGILAPIASQRPVPPLVLRALVLMGTRQAKAHGAQKVVLSLVLETPCELFLSMGFDILQSYEQITSTPEAMAI
ncbi:hypothetical protein ACHAPT_011994 [Fusarium lateritium]